ncbi:unnamed protein product, partial [Ixodes persulcatus]
MNKTFCQCVTTAIGGVSCITRYRYTTSCRYDARSDRDGQGQRLNPGLPGSAARAFAFTCSKL